MAEQTPETLNHFASLSFTEDYWKLPQESRCEVREGFLSRLRKSVDAVHLYQLAALESRGDLLTWTASADEPRRTTVIVAASFSSRTRKSAWRERRLG